MIFNHKLRTMRDTGLAGRTLKRTISLILVFIVFFSTAYAKIALIPNEKVWGYSRDQLRKKYPSNYSECKVGDAKALKLSDVEVNGYNMDAYYVFDEKTWDASGYTYNGLSKIAYLLADKNKLSSSEINTYYQALVEYVKGLVGNPESTANAVTTWKKGNTKIEVGKGKFKNYNGSKNNTVGIVITALKIKKPATPAPTPQPTPKFKYISPTPKPTKTPKPEYQDLNYDGASHNPDQYKGHYVKFKGRVFATNDYTDSTNYFNDDKTGYIQVLVYTKNLYSDLVVVHVSPENIKDASRVADNDIIIVYGYYNGIDDYYEAPEIIADRVKIKK